MALALLALGFFWLWLLLSRFTLFPEMGKRFAYGTDDEKTCSLLENQNLDVISASKVYVDKKTVQINYDEEYKKMRDNY